MSGDVSFFASSLVDSATPGAALECVRLIGRMCPTLTFVDRIDGHFVRVVGGAAPRVEALSSEEQIELARAVESVSPSAQGGLETIPTSWIVDVNSIGHVFVPGPVGPPAADVSYMLEPVSPECCVAPLEELRTHLEEIIASADEVPDEELEELPFLERLLGYVQLAQRFSLVLVVRCI